jgi:SAM-dependent methyltransferase
VINVTCGSSIARPLRERACAGLTGEVLEIGFGSGLNVPHYPSEVHTVLAVEPLARSVALAGERTDAGHVHVDHTGLTGERIDLPSASADAVLSTWTLCSIPDVDRALAEIRRVLRPGGVLHFVEHGLSPDAKVARHQARIEPISKPVFGGCHLTRDIPALLTTAGFVIEDLVTYAHAKEPKAFGWTFEGRATAP